MKELMYREEWTNLASAVVSLAVVDWEKAIRKVHSKSSIEALNDARTLKRWLTGPVCEMYTGVDKAVISDMLKKKEADVIASLERRSKKRHKNINHVMKKKGA